MATLASDDFNRADSGTLGANWTDDTAGLGISGNQASVSLANGQSFWSGTFNPASADYDVTCDLLHTGVVTEMSIFGRRTASDTFYFLAVNTFTQTVQIYKRISGTNTSLGSFGGGYSANVTYTFTLSMAGSTLKAIESSTERISVSNSDITATGKPGLYPDATNGVTDFDNFIVTGTAGGGGGVNTSSSITLMGVGM